MSDQFDPEQADIQDASVSKVLIFGETIGTLVKNGLLDRQLVYDWLWVEGSWAKVAPAARRAREKAGVPQLYENYEALAAGQKLKLSHPAFQAATGRRPQSSHSTAYRFTPGRRRHCDTGVGRAGARTVHRGERRVDRRRVRQEAHRAATAGQADSCSVQTR